VRVRMCVCVRVCVRVCVCVGVCMCVCLCMCVPFLQDVIQAPGLSGELCGRVRVCVRGCVCMCVCVCLCVRVYVNMCQFFHTSFKPRGSELISQLLFFGNSQTSAQQFFVMWWADFLRIFSDDWRHVRL